MGNISGSSGKDSDEKIYFCKCCKQDHKQKTSDACSKLH